MFSLTQCQRARGKLPACYKTEKIQKIVRHFFRALVLVLVREDSFRSSPRLLKLQLPVFMGYWVPSNIYFLRFWWFDVVVAFPRLTRIFLRLLQNGPLREELNALPNTCRKSWRHHKHTTYWHYSVCRNFRPFHVSGRPKRLPRGRLLTPVRP